MSFKIALDAGHGINTSGKRCLASIDPNQTREWSLNSRIADKIQNKLQAYTGYEIIRVDDTTGSTDVPLSTRCSKANNWGANLYLSVHHNAGINGGSGGGLESYVYPTTDATNLSWRNLICDKIISKTGSFGNRSSNKKTADFQVLRTTKMRAVLIECAFMDSAIDTPMALTDEFANKCASGFVEALVEIGNLILIGQSSTPPTVNTTGSTLANDNNVIYQVYTTSWLPSVVGDSDYAGIPGKQISRIYANLNIGSVQYQVHTVGGNWLPWVTDRTDYAGINKPIDAVRIKLIDESQYSIQLRVSPIGGNYYSWVTDNNDYAGVYGKAIDRVQMRILKNDIPVAPVVVPEPVVVTMPDPVVETPITPVEVKQLYRVRIDWSNSKTQIAAFSNLDSAKRIADENSSGGYKVFDNDGNMIYQPVIQVPVVEPTPTPVTEPIIVPTPVPVVESTKPIDPVVEPVVDPIPTIPVEESTDIIEKPEQPIITEPIVEVPVINPVVEKVPATWIDGIIALIKLMFEMFFKKNK